MFADEFISGRKVHHNVGAPARKPLGRRHRHPHVLANLRAFETDGEGFLHISKGPGDYTRRQDAPKVWEYNGAVYVISIPSLLREPLSAFARRLPVVMPRERSVDLDTPLDWTIAEALDRQFNDTPQSE